MADLNVVVPPLLYIYSDPHPVLGSISGHGQEVVPPAIADGSLPHSGNTPVACIFPTSMVVEDLALSVPEAVISVAGTVFRVPTASHDAVDQALPHATAYRNAFAPRLQKPSISAGNLRLHFPRYVRSSPLRGPRTTLLTMPLGSIGPRTSSTETAISFALSGHLMPLSRITRTFTSQRV